MTLLTCVFAAIICSILWYKHAPDNTMRLGTLSLMYWGASLMWLGDAIFEYAELHEAFFTPEPIAQRLLSRLVRGCAGSHHLACNPARQRPERRGKGVAAEKEIGTNARCGCIGHSHFITHFLIPQT